MHSLPHRILLLLCLFLTTVPAPGATSSIVSPATTDNNDSCDIGTAPAATLLLPYFEVNVSGTANTARRTVFSVINVSPYPQIARVTIWTDWSYPVLTTNLFLTGYQVKSVDLRELLTRGAVPTAVISPGVFSKPNYSHKHMSTVGCGEQSPTVPPEVLEEVRTFLTRGRKPGALYICSSAEGDDVRVGSDHGLNIAAGYVTIDVVANCSPHLPTEAAYFTSDLLFDNVLIGDYQLVEPSGAEHGFAGGSPLVHIRAVPEGGKPGEIVATRLPYTFYDRFTDIDEKTPRTIDRRQPLPSAFAARWIDGGATGFETSYAIWREAQTNRFSTCADYAANDTMPVAELVRFDERENAAVIGPVAMNSHTKRGFSAAGVVAPYSPQFPTLLTTDVAGWAYLNLNNGGAAGKTYSAARSGFGSADAKGNWFPRNVSQNWVVVNLFAEDRYGVSFDAAWLGNGCSPAAPLTSEGSPATDAGRIGPRPNVNP